MGKLKALGLLALVLIFAVLPLQTAKAAVLWNSPTLTEVYNPTGNTYAYAPTVIRDGSTEHMWTCHNAQDGVIKDHIFYTKIVNGSVVESKSVLEAGPEGAWDSYHVCDPAIVAGQFQYSGVMYDYALFYLGNDVNASYHNQIGVAFTNDLSGEWVKYPSPIIEYPNDGYWGVGQPSATSIDGQGGLLLFYTKGDPNTTGGYRVQLNLNDMSAPVIGTPLPLTNNGLTDSNGNPDWLNNFDMVYDPTRDRFFAVRDQRPFPSDNPAYISASLQVVSMEGSFVWGGGGSWKVEGALSSAISGKPRNHNASLLRTPYGTLPDPAKTEVYFTVSLAGPALSTIPEYTYDIWRVEGELTDGDSILEKPLTAFSSKLFSVDRLTHNLNTNVFEIHGSSKKKINQAWVGYQMFDTRGYLIEAGTAYPNAINEEEKFKIPILKPAGIDSQTIRLEVYFLSAKGQKLSSKSANLSFSFPSR